MASLNQLNEKYLKIFPLPTITALEKLSEMSWLADSSWYLAGGTGLALQAGHRVSVDLDFFSPKKFILKLKARYPSVAHDYHHILKSLVYFADAENEPTPKINFKTDWRQVKKFFTAEVPKITKEIINLENY